MSVRSFMVRDEAGTVTGPHSSGDLVQLAQLGRLSSACFVRQEGSPTWHPATRVKGLTLRDKQDPAPGGPRPVSSASAPAALPSAIPDDAPDWMSSKDKRHWLLLRMAVRSIERVAPGARSALAKIMPGLLEAIRRQDVKRQSSQHPHDIARCNCNTCLGIKATVLRRNTKK